eukprot:324_1
MNKRNNLQCDIKTCKIYKRNNRQRESDNISSDNDVLNYIIDILDSIHCYFIHSVDTGYRILDGIHESSDDSKDDKSIYYDKQLLTLKSHLKSKRKEIEQIRGGLRVQNNKFMTNIISVKQMNETEIKSNNESFNDDNERMENAEYCFGYQFCTTNRWGVAINKKYSCLKEEIVTNKIYSLELNVFNAAHEKARSLLNNSEIIKTFKAKYTESYGEEIQEGRSLDIIHILSVIFYTDYDTLSYNFSATFRKMDLIEKRSELTNRNKEYGNWTMLLAETVNCYGTNVSEANIQSFYHGVSFLYFNSFIGHFNSPTSTTSKLAVATIFAKNDGIILELTKC